MKTEYMYSFDEDEWHDDLDVLIDANDIDYEPGRSCGQQTVYFCKLKRLGFKDFILDSDIENLLESMAESSAEITEDGGLWAERVCFVVRRRIAAAVARELDMEIGDTGLYRSDGPTVECLISVVQGCDNIDELYQNLCKHRQQNQDNVG